MRRGERHASYTVTVSGLPRDPYELHIHPVEGQPGGHILDLKPPPANGTSSGTHGARRALLIGIYENPSGYFAAVHEDPTYPAYTLTRLFSRRSAATARSAQRPADTSR